MYREYMNKKILADDLYDMRLFVDKKSEDVWNIRKNDVLVATLDFYNRNFFVDISYPKLIALMQNFYKVWRV